MRFPTRTNKARSQRKHAKQRAFERLQLDLTQRDIDRLAEQIRSGRADVARIILKQSNTRSWWRVRYEERWIAVVYDRARGQIVTFLTDEMVEQWKPKAGEWTDED